MKKVTDEILEDKMFKEIKELIDSSRRRVISFVNTEKVLLYWHFGESIVKIFGKEK